MSTEDTHQANSFPGMEDRNDPAKESAGGQTARRVENISHEPSIDRAREAFERAAPGRMESGDRQRANNRLADKSGTERSSTAGFRQSFFGLPRRNSTGGQSAGGGSNALMLLSGIGIGAALMYLLDPEGGRRRRALLRDKLVGATNQTGEVLGRTSRDLSNRARGAVHEARSVFIGGGESEEAQVSNSSTNATGTTPAQSQTAGQSS